MINPAALLRLKNYLGQVRADHPKAVQFVRIMSGKVTEGTVVEMNIELPDGTRSKANIKLSRNDMEFVNELRKVILGDKQ